MLRFIGAAAVIVGLGIGIGMYTGTINVDAKAKVTQKGQQEIKSIRGSVADVVRGK